MSKGKHRIQIRLDDEGWERALAAAEKNGVAYVAPLCEMLLAREYERLGIDKGELEPADSPVQEEHRLNVRIKGGLWERVGARAAALGLSSISDHCRVLLERDLEAWERERAAAGRSRSKKKRQ